jgi:feruloyl esterase
MRSFYIVLFLVSGGAALGAPSKHISVEEVRQVRLPEVELDSVKQIAFDAKKPNAAAHVEVKGTIGGHIRFELLLPDSWNGRFVMGGGGGFVGTVQNVARDTVNKGYATIGTDTGHQSEGVQAGWALDNLEAKVNFGYLAVHRTAEVAKAMIRAYYGQDSERSYFLGCSRGGGQAMMEACAYDPDSAQFTAPGGHDDNC